jgi:hypothetical protein
MLKRAGYDNVTVFEKGERIGGVWFHNTYPGAACDVPSNLYEFSFAPNPRWSRRFAPQPEIQAYIEDVASREGVADRIRTSTEVERATWDEARAKWVLQTSAGEHEADVLVTACGQLSVPSVPPLPGLESFEGPAFHTAEWRHDVSVEGKRVAVIGTGCSAIQTVPSIQPLVEQVDVYQRSPGWTLPKMDFEYRERTKRLFERFPALRRADRAATFAFLEMATAAMTSRQWLMPLFRAIARHQINGAIKDPELRRKVTPTDEVGCKRLMLTDDWYPALTEPNVELVTDRIEEITPSGIQHVRALRAEHQRRGRVHHPPARVGDRARGGRRARARPPARRPHRGHAGHRRRVRPRAAGRAGGDGVARGLHQLVRGRERQRPEPVAVAVDRLPAADGDPRAGRLQAHGKGTRTSRVLKRAGARAPAARSAYSTSSPLSLRSSPCSSLRSSGVSAANTSRPTAVPTLRPSRNAVWPASVR